MEQAETRGGRGGGGGGMVKRTYLLRLLAKVEWTATDIRRKAKEEFGFLNSLFGQGHILTGPKDIAAT